MVEFFWRKLKMCSRRNHHPSLQTTQLRLNSNPFLSLLMITSLPRKVSRILSTSHHVGKTICILLHRNMLRKFKCRTEFIQQCCAPHTRKNTNIWKNTMYGVLCSWNRFKQHYSKNKCRTAFLPISLFPSPLSLERWWISKVVLHIIQWVCLSTNHACWHNPDWLDQAANILDAADRFTVTGGRAEVSWWCNAMQCRKGASKYN